MNSTTINLALNTLKQKGYLAYEYNPFHNYKTSVNLYKINDIYIVPEGMAVNTSNGRLLTKKGKINNIIIWEDEFGQLYEDSKENIILAEAGELYADAGSLIDLDTDKLNFDLNHPVDISILPSYDGSVNLILNDGKNIPRLVNSRFSVRQKNTYEIIDRIGENDTNIYSDENFDKDSSLYFLYGYNPIIKFNGYVDGVLSVGQYCFYLTYCDSDDNESDYIAESGLIPVFIGNAGNAKSMDGGIKNQDSNKGISFYLENLDKSYNYIKIYYVRYFADYGQNRVYEGKKISLRFPINSNTLYFQITGREATEDFDPNILNISKFNPKNVLTQALCKNMLFFGNIVKNTDNYKELLDCAIRIIPKLFKTTIDLVDSETYTGNSGYYNYSNMYGRVGYTNLELYRFGVVFIYNNGTLSNVYNTTGGILTFSENTDEKYYKENSIYTSVDNITLKRNYIRTDEYGWILNLEDYLNLNILILRANSRGVCKINYTGDDNLENVYGINFEIPTEVIEYLLTNLNIRGLFFVRLKRIPNILCLCLLLPMDEVLQGPSLYINGNLRQERFLSTIALITNSYPERVHDYGININTLRSYAAICPDFLLNQPYYNQIFNSSDFYIQKVTDNSKINQNGRYYNINGYDKFTNNESKKKVTLCTVTESVPTVAINNKIYRLNIGTAEQAYNFRCLGTDTTSYNIGQGDDTSRNGTNLFRGIFSPYIAVYSENPLDVNQIYNIYNSNNSSEKELFQVRMNSKEAFYAISDRYNFEKLTPSLTGRQLICYRGDCYLNQFTYRVNRNFNDPTLPNNDVIIDPITWKTHYIDSFDANEIYLSDINAVQMGQWITFRVRSLYNYALRSQDHSFVSEEALMGSPRTYFPRSYCMHYGDYKMPDSYLYNDAYRATLGFKAYFTLQDVNYIKNVFSNRIQYSAIAIQDSFKNNYRESLSTYFRDYSSEYGGIMKLIEINGNLLVVFEHAIAIAIINERILAGQSEGDPVFVNTQNVLPEELTILTDTYGSQWPESVIKTESGCIYGVDSIAKKIWRVKGQNIELLSDFKVNKFLIENITLGERENNPIIGLKNIKTHYNNNKKDVLFTFYDDVYGDEEKVWNLCYNELLGLFVTFYSWVPSYSENIDTQFFTFDRNTSKILSLLESCNYNIPSNTGVLLDIPILRKYTTILSLLKEYNNLLYKANFNNDSIKNLIVYLLEYNSLNTNENISKFNTFYKKLESSYNSVYEYFPPPFSRRSVLTLTSENNTEEDLLNSIDPYGSKEKETGLAPELDPFMETKFIYNSFLDSISDDIKNAGVYHTYLHYRDKDINLLRSNKIQNEDGTYSDLQEIYNLKDLNVSFKLNKDHWGNWKLFEINEEIDEENNTLYKLSVKIDLRVEFINRIRNYKYLVLNIQPELNGSNIDGVLNSQTVVLTIDDNLEKLTTDFYLHGRAGIFNVAENLYPTYWYGEYHPFEFEFVINDKIGLLKIFENLILISNKAEPESFHFEIEGDNYEFSSDKRTMYFRLEATKNLYLNLGSDILYNRHYTDVTADKYTYELYYRTTNGLRLLDGEEDLEKSYNYNGRNIHNKSIGIDKVYPIASHGLVQQVKSTIFPLYYERIDTYNDIYHKYHLMHDDDGIYDLQNLSGSEISWDRDLNQFNIITHIKNSPIDLVGRLKGNSRYKEGKWKVLIPSIIFNLCNEEEWPEFSTKNFILGVSHLGDKIGENTNNLSELFDLFNEGLKYPYIVINSNNIPNDLSRNVINIEDLPNIYNTDNIYNVIRTNNWTYRKEAKIRDKWIKIRVRYSGKNLAVIHSLITLYNVSFS